MNHTALKVGDLARRTGLTIRTLHHYHDIGLLVPSQQTDSGHRLYTANDVARLQQIVSLRQLGFALDDIKSCLDSATFDPLKVVEMHRARIQQQIALQQQLLERLEGIARFLRSRAEVSVESLLQTMEVMQMIEKYYTPEQLAELKQRADAFGPERMREVEAEWPRLIAQVKAAKEAGVDPTSPDVQALAKRWMELVEMFTGGNPEIARSLKTLYEKEPAMQQQAGIDPSLFEYVNKSLKG